MSIPVLNSVFAAKVGVRIMNTKTENLDRYRSMVIKSLADGRYEVEVWSPNAGPRRMSSRPECVTKAGVPDLERLCRTWCRTYNIPSQNIAEQSVDGTREFLIARAVETVTAVNGRRNERPIFRVIRGVVVAVNGVPTTSPPPPTNLAKDVTRQADPLKAARSAASTQGVTPDENVIAALADGGRRGPGIPVPRPAAPQQERASAKKGPAPGSNADLIAKGLLRAEAAEAAPATPAADEGAEDDLSLPDLTKDDPEYAKGIDVGTGESETVNIKFERGEGGWEFKDEDGATPYLPPSDERRSLTEPDAAIPVADLVAAVAAELRATPVEPAKEPAKKPLVVSMAAKGTPIAVKKK